MSRDAVPDMHYMNCIDQFYVYVDPRTQTYTLFTKAPPIITNKSLAYISMAISATIAGLPMLFFSLLSLCALYEWCTRR